MASWRAPAALMAASTAIALLSSVPAFAGLGRPMTSVAEDRTQLRAGRTSVEHDGYTTHELTLPNGGVVKEFTGANGSVFAVTWNAPGRPDLRQLLGDKFEMMQADAARHAGPRVRRPLSVKRSDLLVESGGHPGAFWGAAILPTMQPAGFGPDDLK